MSEIVKPLVAGNWKMNGLRESLAELTGVIGGMPAELKADVMICPPATLISSAASLCVGSSLSLGGQDCHAQASGAHTGDISAPMLRDAGASAVIVGHSERRSDHGETDDVVRSKAQAAWAAGLSAIICVGETEAQRRSGQALDVVGAQLAASVPDGAGAANTVIAYEPVWAIGTGLTPTVDDVAQMHAFLREKLEARFAGEGRRIRLLYGGSVKPANARELMSVANVDGALVGGASLKSSDFLGIINVYS